MDLIGKLFPYPHTGAGWVGHSAPRRLTDAEKAASAARYLAQHRKVEDARRSIMNVTLERFVAAGGRVPITPREINIAPVRARRENAHG